MPGHAPSDDFGGDAGNDDALLVESAVDEGHGAHNAVRGDARPLVDDRPHAHPDVIADGDRRRRVEPLSRLAIDERMCIGGADLDVARQHAPSPDPHAATLLAENVDALAGGMVAERHGLAVVLDDDVTLEVTVVADHHRVLGAEDFDRSIETGAASDGDRIAGSPLDDHAPLQPGRPLVLEPVALRHFQQEEPAHLGGTNESGQERQLHLISS